VSDSQAPRRRAGSGYTPAPETPTRFTIGEFAQLGDLFKKLINDSGLKVWIVLAGLGALAEILHIAWLAVRYIFHF
jgi:hypothetical protein